MYFIVNSENYIVAASKDFLEKCGSRDLCALASSLKDGVFHLESETKRFTAKNFEDEDYEYQTSSLYSPYGTLTLYAISKEEKFNQADIEDESISYLKQLKEGKIAKSDSEFSIPTIESLQKSSSKEVVEEREERIESTKKDIELVDSKQEEKTSELLPAQEEESSFETIKLFSNTSTDESREDEKETIKLFNYSSETIESEETLDSKTTDSEVDTIEHSTPLRIIEKEVEDTTTTKNEELQSTSRKSDSEQLISIDTIEALDDKELDETKQSSKIEQSIEPSSEIKYINVTNEIDQKQEEIIAEKVVTIPTTTESEVEKKREETEKRTLDKIKEKLFPWGSRNKEEEIELEDHDILKPASDLVTNKQEEESKQKEELIKHSEEESSLLKTPLEEKELNIDESEVHNILKSTKQIEKSTETLESQKRDEEPQIDKEKEIPSISKPIIREEKEDLSLEEQELAELKAMHEQQEKAIETTPTVKEVVETKEEEKRESQHLDNRQLYYKIVQMQVNSIDIEKNAANLNIDKESYRMLVDNYLDEIENYHDDIQNRVHSTITMLADAGELLSLNVISKKLNEVAVSSEPSTPLRDLTLLVSLLRDKIGIKSSQPAEATITPETKERDDSNKIEESEKELAFNFVEITTPQDLLAKIEAENIDYDPHKAADELNLPISLIIEFANDFTIQAKEHLSQMIKAYKEGDLKTLQTTAHMLKGAASNLRIDPLAETLFTIQKLQSLSSAEDLLKEFVAKLKGLEKTLKTIEGNSNEN